MSGRNRAVAVERRQKIFVMLTKGMKGYEIARELKVNESTISRDIHFLTSESQNYLNDLAKKTMPFMYQTSIEGIRAILQECWKIYNSDSTTSVEKGNNNIEGLNWSHRLAALKLAKECHEANFELLNSGPSIMRVQMLEDKLTQIEESQQEQQQQQQQLQQNYNNSNQIISR
jgi:hypothetical protein